MQHREAQCNMSFILHSSVFFFFFFLLFLCLLQFLPLVSSLLSEVTEDLLFLAPVHRGRFFLVACGAEFLFGLGCCGAQTQADLHEGV